MARGVRRRGRVARIAAVAIFCCAAALNSGDASQASLDVITLGRAIGLRSPYEASRIYGASVNDIYGRVIEELAARGAQIFIEDVDTGLVSWFDPGAGFIPMPGQARGVAAPVDSKVGNAVVVWRGAVFGTARMRPVRGGTLLHVRATGREVDRAALVFSDGSYERGMLRAVGPGRGAALARSDRVTPGTTGGIGPGSHATAGARLPHLARFGGLDAEALRPTGLEHVYPAPFDAVWSACLDVLAQYDQLIRLWRRDGLVVVGHGIAVPRGGEPPTQVEAVLVVHVERRGSDATAIRVGTLTKGSAVAEVADVEAEGGDQQIARLRGRPEALAPALLARKLFGHVTRQLQYGDRLARKFQVSVR